MTKREILGEVFLEILKNENWARARDNFGKRMVWAMKEGIIKTFHYGYFAGICFRKEELFICMLEWRDWPPTFGVKLFPTTIRQISNLLSGKYYQRFLISEFEKIESKYIEWARETTKEKFGVDFII